ncbi:MAG: LruC domain-containing protein [Cyclobacteriaceae bacterium]
MKTIRIIILINMIMLSSCVQQFGDIQDLSLKPSDDITDFDLETVSLETISVHLKSANEEPLAGILFQIWTRSPLEGGQVILKGVTDANGYFTTKYNLPTTVNQMVLSTDFIGLANYLVINREDLKDDIVIKGMVHNYDQLADELIPNASVSNEESNAISNGRVATNYQALGTFNSSGVPNYLESERDIITADMLSFINASLPEGRPVPTYHPKYIVESAQTNLVITETADVWMTFVHEGAGYRNILGFYTYPTGNPPNSVDDISVLNVVFPNASFAGSGGGLYAGDKVNIGRFSPGTTIGFALLADGWNGSITPGRHQVYSDNQLNPESTPEKRRHSVLLYDQINELFLVGFEDLNRDSGSDDDFNDAIFYISANPIEAISLENVNPIDEPVDTDGDGVNNVYDEFPEDSRFAYSYKYPGENAYGTFAFEDQWPNKGDYDFNDLVVDYQYDQYANGANKMVQLNAEFVIKAVGAGFSNGFGIQLDLNSTSVNNVIGNEIEGNLYSFNGNGTEANQSKAVIIVSDNVHQGFEGNGFINTSSSFAYQTPDTINVEIGFNSAMSLSGAGSAPFNPFIVINKDRGREVHLPSYEPTDLVDDSYFGTSDDNSIEGGLHYRSKTGLPWAMNLPVSFDYPLEKTDIRNGYNHFNRWTQSGGFSYMDWYTNKQDYRSHSHLYTR